MTSEPLTDEQREQAAQWVPLVCRLVRDRTKGQPADVEDAIQDALLRMCKSVKTYNPSRGQLGTHLGTAAKLTAIRSYRHRLVRGFGGTSKLKNLSAVYDAIPQAVGLEDLTEDDLAVSEADEPAAVVLPAVVLSALRNLSARQRQAVVGHYLHGQSAAEMAAVEGRRAKSVRDCVCDGVRRLRAILSSNETTP